LDWEEEMKRFFTIMLGVLLIAAVTAPALAWEFALTGEMEWRYRYFARQGSGDLFGSTSMNPAGVVDQSALGLAGPVNNTVLVQGFSAKQADAQTNDTRVWLFPEIRINPAIRMRGEYWVTGTNLRANYDGGDTAAGNAPGIPANNWVTNTGYNGWFFNAANNPGNSTTPSGMSVGLWEKWWATAQSPWGIIAFGRRPFAFGLGWSTLHEKDANTESIIIVAPYGPMTFIIGPSTVYGAQSDAFTENSAAIIGAADVTNVQTVNALRAAAGTDKGRMRSWHMAGAFTYRNGPVELGQFWTMLVQPNTHFGGGITAFPFTVPAGPGQRDDFNNGAFGGLFMTGTHLNSATTPIFGDIGFVLFVNYFKYNNGRFFLNAEYDFQYADVRRNGGRPITFWGDAWELELGAMCGPAKLAFANFYSSGHDRRGGWLNLTNSTGTLAGGNQVNDRLSLYLVLGGRQEAIKNYAWLVGIYGGGNNSFDGRGYWTAQDFLAYAARLDYAVAANLNVFGSYIYMNRASNTGTPIGSFRGGLANGAFRNNPGFGGAGGAQSAAVPNVPDDYLGWEANVGVDWKLLEGLTFRSQFAYWQPGDWFKWAYVDYSNNNTVAVSGANYPINPNRGIDPLIGFQGSLVVDF
jgi:hypothetical protein